ncbi:unnamed protein product [Echinostoma caproni]|uniref:Dirigent protein n=1 Tax=Echinostoma caproni TaxID=27848 RepID=A0A183AL59_9TREM|nr:unnamed protein product [Echinostoma caproni]
MATSATSGPVDYAARCDPMRLLTGSATARLHPHHRSVTTTPSWSLADPGITVHGKRVPNHPQPVVALSGKRITTEGLLGKSQSIDRTETQFIGYHHCTTDTVVYKVRFSLYHSVQRQ